jgi:hypothetical protein
VKTLLPLSVDSLLRSVTKDFESLVSVPHDYELSQPFCKGYANCKTAMLVSGASSSVLSSRATVNSILKKYANVSQEIDLKNSPEII